MKKLFAVFLLCFAFISCKQNIEEKEYIKHYSSVNEFTGVVLSENSGESIDFAQHILIDYKVSTEHEIYTKVYYSNNQSYYEIKTFTGAVYYDDNFSGLYYLLNYFENAKTPFAQNKEEIKNKIVSIFNLSKKYSQIKDFILFNELINNDVENSTAYTSEEYYKIINHYNSKKVINIKNLPSTIRNYATNISFVSDKVYGDDYLLTTSGYLVKLSVSTTVDIEDNYFSNVEPTGYYSGYPYYKMNDNFYLLEYGYGYYRYGTSTSNFESRGYGLTAVIKTEEPLITNAKVNIKIYHGYKGGYTREVYLIDDLFTYDPETLTVFYKEKEFIKLPTTGIDVVYYGINGGTTDELIKEAREDYYNFLKSFAN